METEKKKEEKKISNASEKRKMIQNDKKIDFSLRNFHPNKGE